jgi:hypothetical protein
MCGRVLIWHCIASNALSGLALPHLTVIILMLYNCRAQPCHYEYDLHSATTSLASQLSGSRLISCCHLF